MNDKGMIATGLIAFIVVMTVPLWYTAVAGGSKRPELEKPVGATKCVKDKAFMTGNHMQLLRDWRDEVVRKGDRRLIMVDGKAYEKSLVNTCLKCHRSKKNFCDRCHDYVDVAPDCWSCHIEPEGK